MKLNTIVVMLKGICYVLIGAFTPWGAALAQWANTGDSPPRMIWMAVIIPASIVGASGSLLSFLSSSFKDFKDTRDAEIAAVPPKTL